MPCAVWYLPEGREVFTKVMRGLHSLVRSASSFCRCRVAYIQVSCAIFSDAACYLYRRRVVFIQVPSDCSLGTAWSFFRCQVVFVQVPCGRYTGVVWCFLFAYRVVFVQVLSGFSAVLRASYRKV